LKIRSNSVIFSFRKNVEIIKYEQLKNAINGGAVRLKKRLIYRVEIRHVVDPNINCILTELSPYAKFKA